MMVDQPVIYAFVVWLIQSPSKSSVRMGLFREEVLFLGRHLNPS